MVKRKPQYVKIKEYIIQNIEDEKYNENEQIESEHALCELFGVTRMTVRQALTDLINENIIYSVPKVGSFVCKKSRFKSFDGLNSVTEDCAKKKEDCTSHVVLNELEEALIMSDIGIETSTKIISNSFSCKAFCTASNKGAILASSFITGTTTEISMFLPFVM